MKQADDLKSINRTITLSVLFVLIFVLAIFTLTFAFFGVDIEGNDTASSISINSVDLGTVNFADGPVIEASNIQPTSNPAERVSKTFTITSTGNEIDVEYEIYMTVSANTFTQGYSNEFTYTLNGVSSSGGTPTTNISAEVPASRAAPYLIGTGVLKANGDVHTYTFTIGLNEMSSLQDYNQGKTFSGTLSVSTKKYTQGTSGASVWE